MFRPRRGPRLARPISMVTATFTATPASATPMTTPPVTAGGVMSRRIASNASHAASTTSVIPLACAERISVRFSP